MWERGNASLFPHLNRSLNWAQLDSLVVQTAVHLNIIPNQTVAYIGEHRLAGLLCYLAVIAAGGRIILLNPSLPPIQQQAIIDDIQVHRVIRECDFADFPLNPAACELPAFSSVQPATLTLTSGSIGKPKAVVHSVAQHLANAEGVCELTGFTASHRWLLSLPLFHVSGQGIVWRWLSRGATLVVGEDKTQFYELLAQASHASLVPTQLQRYLSQRRSQTPQHILLGGTYLPPELIKQAQAQHICTYAGYGMTEMASTICAAAQASDNVGKPLRGREVKLVEGEIYLKGDCLALGYWQQGKLHPLPNKNGWFASKDKGEWNQQGQLKVIGRLDNMFISGGENIQPEQVEQCLYASGLLKQIFILPLDDAEFGQRPIALMEFIEPFSQQAVENLQQFAKQQLEKFKQPIAYYRLESERYPTGIKLSRKQLQQDLNTRLTEQHND